MNFKRNILGLAVVTAISGVSLPAISADLNAPVITGAIEATAPAIDGATFQDNTTIQKAQTLVGDVTAAQEDVTEAQGELQGNADTILELENILAAAALLEDGELYNGATKAEIEDGQGGAGELLTLAEAETAGLQATLEADQATLQDAEDALAVIIPGAISFDAVTGFEQADLATAQNTANGTVGGDTGLAGDVTALEDAIEADNGDGLLKDFNDALGDVTGAQGAVDNGDEDDPVSGEQGVSGAVLITLAAGDAIDLRDVDSQITLDVAADADAAGLTAAGDALVDLINNNDGFSFTAENADGVVTISYSDADDAIAVGDPDFDVTQEVIFGDDNTAAFERFAGTTHVEDSTLGLVLADAQFAANVAQQNLEIAEADLETAEAAYLEGVASYNTLVAASETGLNAASVHLTEIETVLAEQFAVAQADEVAAELAAQAAEITAATDLGTVNTTADALTQASSDQDDAQSAYDDAVDAYIAAPGTETKDAMDAARDELTAATTAEATATDAAEDATDAYYGNGKDADTAIADQDGSNAFANGLRNAVVTATGVVSDVVADQTLQAEIGVAGNPAGALQANLVAESDTGAGVVSAINDTYQLTATNAADITTNAADIASNGTDIATNATGIATNVTGIATNATGIATNATGIATNATGIATNVTGIATNAAGIATNAAGIATNATGIATNVTGIATNAAGIATNVTGIAANKTDIETNKTGIAANATDITTNATGITGLQSSLSDGIANLQRVEMQLNENVDMLKSGIASALAIAGMPTAPGDGMGFSVGTGYFDGESAVAMGLSFTDGTRRYKVSLGHSGGETSASAGAAFKF